MTEKLQETIEIKDIDLSDVEINENDFGAEAEATLDGRGDDKDDK